MSMRSRKAPSMKAFAVEQTVDEYGLLMEPIVRIPKPDNVAKMDKSKHFLPSAESDYLKRALGGIPYATYVTDSDDAMKHLMANGYAHTDGTYWKPFFKFWREQEGHAFLVPEDSLVNDLEDVGITAIVEDISKITGISKGVNRQLAPAPGGALFGEPISYNAVDGIALYKLDLEGDEFTEEEKIITVMYMPFTGMTDEQKALGDGGGTLSEKLCRMAKLDVDPIRHTTVKLMPGMVFRLTAAGYQFGKGHFQFKPGLAVDMVVYGPKPHIQCKWFYLGNLGALHVGIPKTDRQAFINFGFHRPGLAKELADKFMDEVWAASKDELGLMRVFLRNADATPEWLLPETMHDGISSQRFPALFKRVVNYLAGDNSKVFQCVKDARIPMEGLTYGVAKYGYAIADPHVLGDEGEIVPENSVIPDGYIVFPDLPDGTEVVLYRQPSENSNAFVIRKVMSHPAFKSYKGRGVIVLGRGADKILQRLGGGDLDDMIVIVHDKTWVQAFKDLAKYPETKKITREDKAISVEDIGDEDVYGIVPAIDKTAELLDKLKQEPFMYDDECVLWQIEMDANNKTGLGSAVIFGMLDMLFSDPGHKASLLADLERQGEVAAYKWLENYKPWQAANLMTNLELVVDGQVKDPTLLKLVAEDLARIRKWHEECMVYPESLEHKIPAWKEFLGDYVISKSLMCRTLDAIGRVRDRLKAAFVRREYEIVAPADGVLRAYSPLTNDQRRNIQVFLGGKSVRNEDGTWSRVDTGEMSISDQWKKEWEQVRLTGEDFNKAYMPIVERIQERLAGFNDTTKEHIAVELYYRTYQKYQVTPMVDPRTGEAISYWDALLWSPAFAPHFIRALNKAGVTGVYVPAELMPEFRRDLLSSNVKVNVVDHIVYIADEEGAFTIRVGAMFGESYDGMFNMYGGLVEFKRPQPICLPHGLRR